MSESFDDIDEKRTRIKKRIEELNEKGGTGFHRPHEKWPGDSLTVDEQEELNGCVP